MANPGDGARSTRFRPGHSGNPKGRPRKATSTETLSAFEELRQRRITVRLDGIDRELTVEEALLQRMLEAAFAGGRTATRTILKVIVAEEANQAPGHRRILPIRIECLTPQRVDEALAILGIASLSPASADPTSPAILRLEPWAVARGLKRREGRKLSDRERKDLRAHIRDEGDVVWPEEGE